MTQFGGFFFFFSLLCGFNMAALNSCKFGNNFCNWVVCGDHWFVLVRGEIEGKQEERKN